MDTYDHIRPALAGAVLDPDDDTPLTVLPAVSHIEGNLWMGACPVDVAPRCFDYIVDLTTSGGYKQHHHQVRLRAPMHDTVSEPLERDRMLNVAHAVKRFMAAGPTLVHCRAGLNRSGLVTALTLMLHGIDVHTAIGMLRSRRDAAVLNNEHFVGWLVMEHQRLRTGAV